MTGFLSILLLLSIGVGTCLIVPPLAFWLGAPASWFPSNFHPWCPKCRQKALTRVHKGRNCNFRGPSRRVPRQEPDFNPWDFYLCQVCSSRWMTLQDSPWQDASAPTFDKFFRT